jgi:hypothetical protein
VTSGGEQKVPRNGIRHTHVLQVWDATSGRLVAQRLDADVSWAMFTPGGEHLLVWTGPSSLQLLDARTLQPTGVPRRVRRNGAVMWPYAISGDGRTAVLLADGTTDAALVDVASGTWDQGSFDVAPDWGMALSPDGGRLVVIDRAGKWGVLETRSLTRNEKRWLVPPRELRGGPFWEVTWSADGTQVLTTRSGAVDLWDARTLTHIGSLEAGAKDYVATVRPLPDGQKVVIGHPRGDVLTWDLRPDHLVELTCSLAGRDFTRQEWQDRIGNRPYRRTCTGG